MLISIFNTAKDDLPSAGGVLRSQGIRGEANGLQLLTRTGCGLRSGLEETTFEFRLRRNVDLAQGLKDTWFASTCCADSHCNGFPRVKVKGGRSMHLRRAAFFNSRPKKVACSPEGPDTLLVRN